MIDSLQALGAALSRMSPGDELRIEHRYPAHFWPNPRSVMQPDDGLSVAERATRWLDRFGAAYYEIHDQPGFVVRIRHEVVTLIGGPANGKKLEVRDGCDILEVEDKPVVPPFVPVLRGRRRPVPADFAVRRYTYKRVGNTRNFRYSA